MTREDESRPVVVQKFGGTSVATLHGRAALCTHVRAALDAGETPVVVVSAMGRAGEPYATDTLLGLLGDAAVDAREADLLAGCGEIITAVVVAHELRAAGVAASAFSGAAAGIHTDGRHGDASVLYVDPAPVSAALEAGLVPVVAGFQGLAEDGSPTTLGRGGSDTTACALAVALHALRAEIFTDVAGVMSADPRVCDGARVLDSLQFEELFQMARGGAKVMHAPAAETAMEGGVPVVVRGTLADHPGTFVSAAAPLVAGRTRLASAVTEAEGIARFVVTLPQGSDRESAITAIFRSLADAGASLDMFTPLEDSLAFSVDEPATGLVDRTLADLGITYACRTGLAKVTLVGAGMHGVPGVMARVAEALSARGIPLLQVADSHYTISILVAGTDARPAVEALHDAFGLGVE